MKNFIFKYKFSIGLVILVISLIMAISKIKSKNSEIDSLEYEVNELHDKVTELETKVAEFEDQFENNVAENSDSNIPTYQTNYSTLEGEEIKESELYRNQGTAVVVFTQSGCDYMILENNSGYILAQWMGGNEPENGESVGGNFKSYGTKDYYNLSSNSKCRLWIDDYMLSKESALEKIADKCN